MAAAYQTLQTRSPAKGRVHDAKVNAAGPQNVTARSILKFADPKKQPSRQAGRGRRRGRPNVARAPEGDSVTARKVRF